MLNILGLVGIFAIIIALQVPLLIKKQMWPDLIMFSVLMLMGMVLSFGLVLDLPMPNPINLIELIFEPATQFIDNLIS